MILSIEDFRWKLYANAAWLPTLAEPSASQIGVCLGT
jgi:hypothetical protein